MMFIAFIPILMVISIYFFHLPKEDLNDYKFEERISLEKSII